MMKKKILIRSIIGFLLGMVLGNLIMIFLSGGTFPWAPDTLILRFGSIQKVMILQTLFSGLMGAIAMGGSVVYEMDDWSLFSVTGIHYLLTMGSFLVISSVMDWCSDAKTYLVIIVLMTVAYVLVWLIMYKGKNLRTAVQLMLMCLPSLAVMILQFVLAFYGGNSKSGGITIAPFVVAGARTPSIPISMLLLLAFPLMMLLLAAIRKSVSWGDIFAWIMLLWGLIWRLFLAEKGERTYHGNFSWGYMLAVYLVWYTAVRSYLKLYFSEQMTGNKRGAGFVLATILLVLHLVSGLYYLIYLVALGHGM